jgi:hypothetical protein
MMGPLLNTAGRQLLYFWGNNPPTDLFTCRVSNGTNQQLGRVGFTPHEFLGGRKSLRLGKAQMLPLLTNDEIS